MKTIAAEIAELRSLDMLALQARYLAIFGRATRSKNREQLWRRIAWGIQAQRHGGLSDAARTKIAELQVGVDLPVEVTAVLQKKASLPVGRVISREWRGQQIEVTVTAKGYEWKGMPFKSLSAVAKAITGTAWNGPVFFGLKERKRK